MFCWFFRLMISHLNDVNRPVRGATKRHLSKCDDCRQFHDLCHLLGKALSDKAKVLGQFCPSSLNEQILQNIAKSDMNSTGRRIRFHPMAVAAGIVFFLLIGIFLPLSGRKTENNDKFNDAVAEFAGFVNISRGRELTGLVEKPFETELQYIISDTKSAANFLFTCVAVDLGDTENIEEIKQKK